MNQAKPQKTDRRTLYTKRAIREAFLQLKRSKAYGDITVADICREAEISRGTFYLHYRNTADVLDEVLTQALSSTRTLEEQLYPQSCSQQQCSYPLCEYIRNSKEYRCLFFDDALSAQIVEKIYLAHRSEIIRMWSDRAGLSSRQLEMIAWFQINGCFAAAKKSEKMSDEQWKQSQQAIDSLLRNGLHFFKSNIEQR